MQIVIEIDEELYTALMNGYEEPYSRQFSDCVRSGTVLPDDHGRLIDEKELVKYIIHDNCEDGCGYIDERDLIDIPAVVVADNESKDKE